MLAPYYEGDAVPVSFYVREGFKPRNPHSASVTVYRGKEVILSSVSAEVSGNLVRYTVPSDYTYKRGDYMAEFTVYLPAPRTHKIWFRILPRGAVISKQKDAEFTKDITDKSTAQEIDSAVGMATRALRRIETQLVKVSKMANDIVSKKSNKRLPVDHYNEEDY
jgi:hypothetical protein